MLLPWVPIFCYVVNNSYVSEERREIWKTYSDCRSCQYFRFGRLTNVTCEKIRISESENFTSLSFRFTSTNLLRSHLRYAIQFAFTRCY